MGHRLKHVEKIYPSVDVEKDDNQLDWEKVEPCGSLALYAQHKTGAKTSYRIGIKMSPDGVIDGGWHMKDGTVQVANPDGHIHVENINSMAYVRPAVYVKEPSAQPPSTADIVLQGFVLVHDEY